MIVIAGQSLFDIANQKSGSVYTVFDWALANDISPTALLTPGITLIEPDAPVNRDLAIMKHFKNRRLATLHNDAEGAPVYLDYLFPQTFPLL